VLNGGGGAVELALYSASAERMRLDSSGNIGIGGTPAEKLDIIAPDNSSIIMARVTRSGKDYGLALENNGLTGDSTINAFAPDGGNARLIFETVSTERMRLDSSGNLLLGGSSSPASATRSFAIFNGTAPTGSVANGVILYAEDVSTSSELKVRDEAGNITTLSPHNFSQIPEGPSEDMAFSYYSEKDNKYINVDMLAVVRELEKLSGKQFVYTGSKKRTRKTKRRMK
jgi:hypothetical protein